LLNEARHGTSRRLARIVSSGISRACEDGGAGITHGAMCLAETLRSLAGEGSLNRTRVESLSDGGLAIAITLLSVTW